MLKGVLVFTTGTTIYFGYCNFDLFNRLHNQHEQLCKMQETLNTDNELTRNLINACLNNNTSFEYTDEYDGDDVEDFLDICGQTPRSYVFNYNYDLCEDVKLLFPDHDITFDTKTIDLPKDYSCLSPYPGSKSTTVFTIKKKC